MGFWSTTGKDTAIKAGKATVKGAKRAGTAVKEKSTTTVGSHGDAWDKKNNSLIRAIEKAEGKLTTAQRKHDAAVKALKSAEVKLKRFGNKAPLTKEGQNANARVAGCKKTATDTEWLLGNARIDLNNAKRDHAQHQERKSKKPSGWL